MIKDPCKQGKCILYPICLNKDIIECNVLIKSVSNHLMTFIRKDIQALNSKQYTMTIEQAQYIHNHITKIFPNLKRMPYAPFGFIAGDIAFKTMKFTTAEKIGNAYKLVSYRYSPDIEDVYGGTKQTSYRLGNPLRIFAT
jgi:hypothetical protein